MSSLPYSGSLRAELALRNHIFARGLPHVESYGSQPVVVYAPEDRCHGNFYEPAYSAICAQPEWNRRFDKIHTQGRSLPRASIDSGRKWRELDSCMSSDALLMNVFCTPEVIDSPAIHRLLAIQPQAPPEFGWRARVPLLHAEGAKPRFDRTEVDMRWGDLLVESKLTESDFQCREAAVVESYRDLDAVFDRTLLPRIEIRTTRRRMPEELAEEFTQEWEPAANDDGAAAREYQAALVHQDDSAQPRLPGYSGYQLIRNVLAAYANNCSFCVIHDERRPDLREAWFRVMSAVRSADMRARCKVITWQELVPALPQGLQHFLDVKYGIVSPGAIASSPLDIPAED